MAPIPFGGMLFAETSIDDLGDIFRLGSGLYYKSGSIRDEIYKWALPRQFPRNGSFAVTVPHTTSAGLPFTFGPTFLTTYRRSGLIEDLSISHLQLLLLWQAQDRVTTFSDRWHRRLLRPHPKRPRRGCANQRDELTTF